MSNVTTAKLSSKRQITVPARMARALGLEPGSTLLLRLEDDRIVLMAAPASYTEALEGSMSGTYGDPDSYFREERSSWGE
jgi:AbrB family looped-hinge helix DNA binding protein